MCVCLCEKASLVDWMNWCCDGGSEERLDTEENYEKIIIIIIGTTTNACWFSDCGWDKIVLLVHYNWSD